MKLSNYIRIISLKSYTGNFQGNPLNVWPRQPTSENGINLVTIAW